MSDIDHEYTDNIICPHCGEEYLDSWEIDEDWGTEECYACEKSFKFERNVEVTYNTKKV